MLLLVLPAFVFLSCVSAHSRWSCPQPRNPEADITVGPCGDETNDFSANDPIMEIAPGPMLVEWEEAVSHEGSPFRIALSHDGTDDGSPACILLDHIPHNNIQNPDIEDESTYTKYSMVIIIPDVACERCSLHLANPRTADEGALASPTGLGCTDPDGTCKTVYHSCTIPFKITGSIQRSEFQCLNQNPPDWPELWIGDNGSAVNADVIGVYRREAGNWVDSFLVDVPAEYRTVDDGVTLCTGPTLSPAPGGEESLFQRFWQLILALLGRLGLA